MRQGKVYYNDVYCGIIREDDGVYFFIYDDEYLNNKNSKPISLTMPLNRKIYESNILFPFFDGLIPEGYLLEIAIKVWKLDYNDRMGLLLKVCEDTIGAVSIKGDNYE